MANAPEDDKYKCMCYICKLKLLSTDIMRFLAQI